MAHTCHAWGCNAPCPPRLLMCRPCWDRVPKDVQQEVYRTVGLRGSRVDATWAPWWKAQTEACAAAAPGNGVSKECIDFEVKKGLDFAKTLEGR